MNDFQKYIQTYLGLVPTENWIMELKNSGTATSKTYADISATQANFAYADGKWNLKELLQHLIDAERIFAYRALRFARKDKTPLAGWDEEMYAESYFSEERSLESLITEFESVRQSSLIFFKDLNHEQLCQTGIANGNEISVETLGRLIVGHNIHHLKIIKERYLPFL
ncbi:DinB family protein [Kaistella palustris]|uniref:DinB family protein n=1 Tax=Kaistella palustris TaxID=493376 RepID=UPI0003F9AC2F|nr:DinB family protein [Kaistella palustris]